MWIGALIYFFVRWLPRRLREKQGGDFKRIPSRRKILEAEMAVRNIGNAYQYIQLADLYFDAGNFDKAITAYKDALSMEEDNPETLWNLSRALERKKEYESAKTYLEKLFAIDKDFGYGDASMLYCRILFATGETDKARKELEAHLEKFTHPEAYVLLAEILLKEGENERARSLLEKVIGDLKVAPKFNFRKNRKWYRKAKALLMRANIRS
jgi:hypothetical protein